MSILVLSKSNMDVIQMFVSDSFPKDKLPTWGSENLKINKEEGGWSLINYSTPIVFRNDSGEVFFNTQKYSVTTSKIQNYIRGALAQTGISASEVDEVGMRQAMDAALDQSYDKAGESTSAKKTAEYVPDDLDDVRDNPTLYGLPLEAKGWTDEKIMDEFSQMSAMFAEGAKKVAVTPEGWEGTVKELKKHKDKVDNPWALVNWMKDKGYKPHASKDNPATIRVAVAPPGWEKTVRKMKKNPEIDNPWALAWSEKNKGYKPSAAKLERLADHEGWKNYATWGVALILDNDRDLYDAMATKIQELMVGVKEHENVKKNTWSEKQAVLFDFQSWLESFVEERVAGVDNPMASQLIQAGLSEVDWREISEAKMEEVEGYAALPGEEKTGAKVAEAATLKFVIEDSGDSDVGISPMHSTITIEDNIGSYSPEDIQQWKEIIAEQYDVSVDSVLTETEAQEYKKMRDEAESEMQVGEEGKKAEPVKAAY